jgi:hypothetical protein
MRVFRMTLMSVYCTRYWWNRNLGHVMRPTVLKGFLEYWSPTTNSFHLPYGEMSITLWDLHRIAGLPITSKFYDEFIPTNRELAFVSSPDHGPFISETTIERFKEMSKFPNFHKIPPLQWLAHFSRGLRYLST